MNIRKIGKAVSAAVVFAAATISPVWAVECPSWLPAQMCGAGAKAFDLQSIAKLILYILIVAAVLWALWNVVQAGLMYSGAGEDADKKKKATQKIIAAVVGLIIVVVSFTILSLIGKWFGPVVEYFGPPCTADEDTGSAKDNTTPYGILLRKGTGPANAPNFGCGDDATDYICVNPQPAGNDFSKAAIDCTVQQ